MPEKPEDFVFFATLGQTDVQVVVDGKERVSIEKVSQRDFHRACRESTVKWRMHPLPDTPLSENRRLTMIYDPERNELRSRRTDDNDGRTIPCGDASTPVILASPLLAKACGDIEHLQDKGLLGKAIRALLIYTDRVEHAQPTEPVAAYNLVRGALAEALGLTEDLVEGCNAFQGSSGDVMESDQHGTRCLSAACAKRIDDAIRSAAGEYGDYAVTATTGGIPEIKLVVEAAVAYRFNDWVKRLPPGEGGRGSGASAAIIPPDVSLLTRLRVRGLVKSGDLDGAAAIAAPGRLSPDIEPWRAMLEAVADLLSGQSPDKRLMTSKVSKVVESIRNCKCCSLLLVAFRVENALRRCDTLAAIIHTTTFNEAAFRYSVDKHLRRNAATPCVDWQGTGDLCPANMDKAAAGVIGVGNPSGRAARNALKSFLPTWAQFNGQFSGTHAPLLRHCYLHSGLVDAKRLRDVAELLRTRGVWKRSAHEPEFEFLDVVLVKNVFNDLQPGLVPSQAYKELTNAILHDMDAWSFVAPVRVE